jgi:hypothetical protein
MKPLFRNPVCACLLIFLIGCAASRIEMDVKSYSDPERDLTQSKRFKLAPIDQKNPLLEKELLFMIKQRLIDKGFIENNDNPDFLIVLSSYCGPFQYYVPPTTLYLPQYVPGQTKTYTGWIGDAYYFGTEKTKGKVESVPYTTGGYTETAYYRNITLFLVDVPTLIKNQALQLIWQGQVESSGSTSDIKVVAPYLLDELLSEFPKPSGKPNVRSVFWPGR